MLYLHKVGCAKYQRDGKFETEQDRKSPAKKWSGADRIGSTFLGGLKQILRRP